MDFWQLELDTLTVGSVVGVVELKGQCMSFDRFPSWGVGRNLPPVFFGGIFPKVEKKRPPVLSRAEKNGEKKTRGFRVMIFAGCFLKDAGRCVNPFIDVR